MVKSTLGCIRFIPDATCSKCVLQITTEFKRSNKSTLQKDLIRLNAISKKVQSTHNELHCRVERLRRGIAANNTMLQFTKSLSLWHSHPEIL
jgi:hypothetical protein